MPNINKILTKER